MMSTPWVQWADAQNHTVRAAGQWRETRPFDSDGISGDLAGAGLVVSFATNDYLGLTQHPAVVNAAHEALDRWGAGSGSARLIVGSRPVHHELEDELARWKHAEAALLFPTGFQANLSVLTTFGGAGTTILSDELNHASIIDGCKLARGAVAIWRHNDLDHLAHLLAEHQRAVVVADSVFSMDGDTADVDSLATLCDTHGALLVLDEAHAVLGPELGAPAEDLLRVGTLSKYLGSLGGFVAGPSAMIDLLRNRARPFIFTTAGTPADTAAALAALRVLCSPEGETLVARLRSHVDLLRPGHPSPIVAVVLGEEAAALEAAAQLLAAGLHVPAIRPPTVAPGTSRLRVTLSARHTAEQVTRLVDALEAIGAP